jgi:hypothetical protein
MPKGSSFNVKESLKNSYCFLKPDKKTEIYRQEQALQITTKQLFTSTNQHMLKSYQTEEKLGTGNCNSVPIFFESPLFCSISDFYKSG